jgi:hypothetical protein
LIQIGRANFIAAKVDAKPNAEPIRSLHPPDTAAAKNPTAVYLFMLVTVDGIFGKVSEVAKQIQSILAYVSTDA